MPIKWTIFVLIIWIACAILSGILEDAYLGGCETSTLNVLMAHKVFVEAGGVPTPIPNPLFWKAFLTVFTFDFAMFQQGMGQLIKYIFWAIGIATMISLGVTFASIIRGGGGTSG